MKRLLLAVPIAGAVIAFWPRCADRTEAPHAVNVSRPVAWTPVSFPLPRRSLPRPKADAVAYGMDLSEALRTNPALADELIERFDGDEETLFQTARALAPYMNESRARRLLARPRRDLALYALLGRPDLAPVQIFRSDPDPHVRAVAAFVLSEVVDRLPRRGEILQLARIYVQTGTDELKIESMDLLASAGLQPDDVALIERTFENGSPDVRLGAVRALAAGGAPAELVRNYLHRLADDPALPAEMRDTIARTLGR